MKVKTIIERSDTEYELLEVQGTAETVPVETAVVYQVKFIAEGIVLNAEIKLLSGEFENLTYNEIRRLVQRRFVRMVAEMGVKLNDPQD